jgi:hypothetical protein
MHWHPGALTDAQCATGAVADQAGRLTFPPTRDPTTVAREWAVQARLADSFPVTRTGTARPNSDVRVVSFLQLNDLVGRVTFERTQTGEWQVVNASACALPAHEPPPTLTSLDEATTWLRERYPWVTAVTESPRPVNGHAIFEVSATTLDQRDELQATIDHFQLNDVLIVEDTGLG